MNIGTFQAVTLCYLETHLEFASEHADILAALRSVEYCNIKVSQKLVILHFLRNQVRLLLKEWPMICNVVLGSQQ